MGDSDAWSTWKSPESESSFREGFYCEVFLLLHPTLTEIFCAYEIALKLHVRKESGSFVGRSLLSCDSSIRKKHFCFLECWMGQACSFVWAVP